MTERKTIRQLREERGWRQIDLALRLGVDPGTIHKWERGYRPRAKYQQRLADLFGVAVEAIAFGPAEQANRSEE